MKVKELYEAVAQDKLKRAEVREKGETSTDDFKGYPKSNRDGSKIIGWFNNTHNTAGWGIYTLQKSDKKWLADNKQNTNGVYRVASDKATVLAKFNLKTGQISFLDNEKYEDTDKIHWQRATAYKQLLIDDGMQKHFNVV